MFKFNVASFPGPNPVVLCPDSSLSQGIESEGCLGYAESPFLILDKQMIVLHHLSFT